MNRLNHLVHGFIDLAAFFHLTRNRFAVGRSGVIDPGGLLVYVRRRPADRADQLGNPVGHVIEFRRQLAQLIAVAQTDVRGHVAGGNVPRGFAEAVDGSTYGHEEADVEIDNHKQHGDQGNHDQATLVDLTLEPCAKVRVDHAEGSRLDVVVVGQLPGHQIVVFGPGHFQTHGRYHVQIQMIPNHHQTLVNPLNGVACLIGKGRRCFRSKSQGR